jgi:hypothetical protein
MTGNDPMHVHVGDLTDEQLTATCTALVSATSMDRWLRHSLLDVVGDELARRRGDLPTEPPVEEPTFLVVWTIEVGAADERQAADRAREIQRDRASLAGFFHVGKVSRDPDANWWDVDLDLDDDSQVGSGKYQRDWWHGTVSSYGGGQFVVHVDRDTREYPGVGQRVAVMAVPA